MSDNILIILSCGTDNPNRSTRAFFLAMLAHKEGKKSAIFLLDEAVYLARQGIADHLKAATGDSADDFIAYLQANEVPIFVCTPCAKARQIEEKDLISGAAFSSASVLIKMASESSVISL